MNDPRETLNRIRKQANNATEGPWEAVGGFVESVAGSQLTIVECSDPEDHDVDNAEFIAAARTTVPALLDALEKVLELHSPRDDAWSPDITCSGCYDSYYDVYEPYPCELVEAITTALDGIR